MRVPYRLPLEWILDCRAGARHRSRVPGDHRESTHERSGRRESVQGGQSIGHVPSCEWLAFLHRLASLRWQPFTDS